MKIRTKLLTSYVLIIAMFMTAGVITLYNINQMSTLQNNVETQIALNNNAYGYQQAVLEKQFGLVVYTQGDNQNGAQIVTQSRSDINTTQAYLIRALVDNPTMLQKFVNAWTVDTAKIDSTASNIVTISNTNNQAARNALYQIQLSTLTNDVTEFNTKIAEFRNATMTNVQDAMTQSQNYASTAMILSITSFAIASVAGVLLAVVIGNRISNPLRQLTAISEKVSMGELDHEIKVNTKDEINDLAQSFQRMINAFKVTESLSKETSEEA
jgi:nitrogen fixation/metabolism regulation signal transduction histidine kinase